MLTALAHWSYTPWETYLKLGQISVASPSIIFTIHQEIEGKILSKLQSCLFEYSYKEKDIFAITMTQT